MLKQVFEFQKKLQKELGDDLVYGVCVDNDMYILTISTHKSPDWEFSHGREMQTCRFSDSDLELPLDEIVENVVALYKAVLVRIGEDDVII